MDLTTHWAGFLSLAIFIGAYSLVILEENIHLKKSKPVIVAAGLIWMLVAIAYMAAGDSHTAEELVRHNLLEFAELFFFLLAAMTYINTMEERGIFEVLRAWLVNQGFSLSTGFLDYRWYRIFDVAGRRQPRHRPVDGNGGDIRWWQQSSLRDALLYQHRGRGQCGWRL